MSAFAILLVLPLSSAVIHSPYAYYRDEYNSSNDVFVTCWQAQTDWTADLPTLGQSMGACLKNKMYQGLVSNVGQDCVDIGDGVSFLAEDGGSPMAPRDLFPTEEEPSSFRALTDAYSSFLSRRAVRWDLGHLYPGLMMKIGPTFDSHGTLEFVMDQPLHYHDRSKLGPGQQLIRRAILPHLLGFRMNTLRLLPLVFGVLIYVAKNAFIFSKLTLIISTLLALKSLFVLQHLRPPAHGAHGGVYDDVDAAGSEPFPFIGGPRPQPHSLRPEVVMQLFSGNIPPFRGVNSKPEDARVGGVRNFAWEK